MCNSVPGTLTSSGSASATKHGSVVIPRLGGAVEHEAALASAAAASERAAQLTQTRYRAGSDSFLMLLVAERDRAIARAALAQARADRADAQVSLFKALGGGWEDAPDVEIKAAGK